MKSNTSLIIAGVIVVVVLVGFTALKKPPEKPPAYECLTQAGYSWDEYVGACVKSQSLEGGNMREAAKVAVEYAGASEGFTVTQVDAATVDGIFLVHLTKDGETMQVALNNWQVTTGEPRENPAAPKLLPIPAGGEPDEDGCIGTALYVWDESIGACMRIRGITDENQRTAAKTAVAYMGYEKGTSVLGVDTLTCRGCFNVHLYRGGDRVDVYLADSKATGKTMTPKECETTGGRITVNETDVTQCQPDEKETGKIAGYLGTALCCNK